MKDGDCMDCFEAKQELIEKDKAEISFKGWNIKNPLELIKEEIEDHLEEYIENLEIVEKKEIAYSFSRFCDGCDAKDEGYSGWINYHTNWRKGLGKCTSFKVTYKIQEMGSKNE